MLAGGEGPARRHVVRGVAVRQEGGSGKMADQIPVIDLEAALGDNAPDGLLGAVRGAAERTGVIQLVNHGVPGELLADYSSRIGRLLSLPRADKARLASPGGHPYRGWRQWPDDFGRLELERYNVAQFDTPADAQAAGVPAEYASLYEHPNVWPPDDQEFRGVTFRYLDAARQLAGRVLQLYARALGVAAGTFALGTLPHARLTTNDYPTWSYPGTGSDEDKLLLLEHADDSAVTILGQEGDYQGLQVQLSDGSWLPVPVVPGALQAFSGELLTRWTGGRLRAGRHRVVAGGTMTRRSTAVFCYPSLETVVEPLAPFAGPDGRGDFQPVLVWDHVRRRVEDYLAEYGRPEQEAAWREGKPYIADLSGTSAGH
jgi:isopenicillin N synthase-like dioxygenase